MSQTIIIGVLAILVVYLFFIAKNQRKKSRNTRNKIVDRAWRRNE